jgi:hypothetical protein
MKENITVELLTHEQMAEQKAAALKMIEKARLQHEAALSQNADFNAMRQSFQSLPRWQRRGVITLNALRLWWRKWKDQ